MHRRHFLSILSGAAIWLATRNLAGASNLNDKVSIMQFMANGKPQGLVMLNKIHADWRHKLSPLAYQVTRENGTERAFSQPGYDRHDAGLYRCICCDNALFDSSTKFDSHTGWPSFWQPVASQNVREIADNQYGMKRTEVQCALCDAHLGHVFDDGPKPTGLRYCMNNVALRFAAYTG